MYNSDGAGDAAGEKLGTTSRLRLRIKALGFIAGLTKKRGEDSMRRLTLVVVSAGAFVGSAYAADMPRKAPILKAPPPVPAAISISRSAAR